MKHIEIIEHYTELSEIKDLVGFDINYKISKNIRDLKQEVNTFKEMEKKINRILLKYEEEKAKFFDSLKGVIKTPTKRGIKFNTTEEHREAVTDFEDKMKVKYKKEFEQHNKEWKAYQKFIEETENTTYKPTMIEEKFVPKNINTQSMNAIMYLIIPNK